MALRENIDPLMCSRTPRVHAGASGSCCNSCDPGAEDRTSIQHTAVSADFEHIWGALAFVLGLHTAPVDPSRQRSTYVEAAPLSGAMVKEGAIFCTGVFK